MQDLPIFLDFEPQDDIEGFLRRWKSQKEAGRELVCPFKFDGNCNNEMRTFVHRETLCDNDYTSCQDYKNLIEVSVGV